MARTTRHLPAAAICPPRNLGERHVVAWLTMGKDYWSRRNRGVMSNGTGPTVKRRTCRLDRRDARAVERVAERVPGEYADAPAVVAIGS